MKKRGCEAVMQDVAAEAVPALSGRLHGFELNSAKEKRMSRTEPDRVASCEALLGPNYRRQASH
jgi:hypothetical protein